MRLISLIALFFIFSCQDYNSNSSDKEKFGPQELTGSANFQKAYPILVKRCANCHTSSIHSPWASYTNEATWDSKDLIVPGDSRNSKIIIYTINTGGNLATMPQGASALPDSEYQILLQWIDGL